MTDGQFLNAVAVVGYAAAGLGGGLLAAAVAFSPSFAFVLLSAGRFDRLSSVSPVGPCSADTRSGGQPAGTAGAGQGQSTEDHRDQPHHQRLDDANHYCRPGVAAGTTQTAKAISATNRGATAGSSRPAATSVAAPCRMWCRTLASRSAAMSERNTPPV